MQGAVTSLPMTTRGVGQLEPDPFRSSVCLQAEQFETFHEASTYETAIYQESAQHAQAILLEALKALRMAETPRASVAIVESKLDWGIKDTVCEKASAVNTLKSISCSCYREVEKH